MTLRLLYATSVVLGCCVAPLALLAQAADSGKGRTTAAPEAQPRTGRDDALTALGRRIFFDTRLSADGTVSCATCHRPEHAFTDGRPTARGVFERTGLRNTPSLLNVGMQRALFWDGRRTLLEEQVLDPFVNPVEHGLPDHEALLARLRADAEYAQAFDVAFRSAPEGVTLGKLASALKGYLLTLVSLDSPFDRYYGGDESALSTRARQGFELFAGRAGCIECHQVGVREATFSDGRFHSTGVGLERIQRRLPEVVKRVRGLDPRELDRAVLTDPEVAELGRFVVTRDPRDIGKFKTPSLRNVAQTAPYMHDGSVATLEQALDQELYYRGLTTGQSIALTPDEKAALLEFLRAVSSRAEATR